MKKYIFIALLIPVLVVGAFSVVTPAHAQSANCPAGFTCTSPTCPAGYTCTPINCPAGFICSQTDKVPNCPPGYFCTVTGYVPLPSSTPLPSPYVSSDASASISGTPTLALTYDSNQKESSLNANFTVNVNGGSQGIYILRQWGGVTLIDQNGKSVNANSVNNVVLTPINSLASTIDNYGQTLYVVPPNQTAQFTGQVSANPLQIFAGSYKISLNVIGANSTKIIDKEYSLPVSGNKLTNSVTILGEVSPYIVSITNPATVGQGVVVAGARLASNQTVLIDGRPFPVAMGDMSFSSQNILFHLPTFASGHHTVQVSDPATGMSNALGFEVINTSDKGCYQFTTNMQLGASGPDVTALQAFLTTNGYSIPGILSGETPKGYFGQTTYIAVKQYQAAHGLPATGFVGPLTRASLNASCLSDNATVTYQAPVTVNCPVGYICNTTSPSVGPPASSAGTPDLGTGKCLGGSAWNSNDCANTSNSSLNASLLSSYDDRAGTWGVFTGGPGAGGAGTYDSADWNISATLNIPQNAAISSMTLRQSNTEYWSTNNPKYFPLVVIPDTGGVPVTPIVSQYSNTLGKYTAGPYKFRIFAQKNTTNWVGGALTVTFSDGSQVVANIPAASTTQSNTTMIPSTSTISSGGSVKLYFTWPQNSVAAYLTASCPNSISTNASPEQCNRRITVTSNSDYTLPFFNSSSQSQNVQFTYQVVDSSGASSYDTKTITVLSGTNQSYNPAPTPTYTPYPTYSPSPTPSVSTYTPDPVASLTADNGSHNATYYPGQTYHYYWSGSNGDTFTSYVTSNNTTQCGQGTWLANNSSGSFTNMMNNSQVGCVWTVTYTVTNSATGRAKNDTMTVRVVSPTAPSPTPSPSPSAYAPNQDSLSASIWSAIKDYWAQQ